MTEQHHGWEPQGVICPYCLDPVTFDETRLYTLDARQRYQPLDISHETNPLRRQDALRGAFQQCSNTGGMQAHYLPAPYLTHGQPLTVAMVGSSAAGKTHLLAAMLAEVERGGLDRHGLKCRPLNPDWHRRFLRERVQPLQAGQVLAHTPQTQFADFADGLLVSRNGLTRPVVFFDLSGEDLVDTGRVTRFLAGVNAFIFVVDPLRALRLPQLAPVRERTALRENDLGDESFGTVLNRVPRTAELLRVAATVVVNKSDLLRFDPPVDRWLGEPVPAPLSAHALWEESRDVYAFLRHHGSTAWLKPFADCARCTLHFVSATGSQDNQSVFPQGVRPRRVLLPLLAIFAMSGLLTGADMEAVGL